MTSKINNEWIVAPKHEEYNCYVLMDEGVDTNKLERKLCPGDKEVVWATRKNNQQLRFNVGALLPSWTLLFKLRCSSLIPITHKSHVTLNRDILLYAMIEKKKVDARLIIFNNILESVGPNKWTSDASSLESKWTRIK